MLNENDIIEVIWEDILDCNGWLIEAEARAKKPVIARSLDYFLSDSEHFIQISPTILPELEQRGVIVIPKGVVKQIINHSEVQDGTDTTSNCE